MPGVGKQPKNQPGGGPVAPIPAAVGPVSGGGGGGKGIVGKAPVYTNGSTPYYPGSGLPAPAAQPPGGPNNVTNTAQENPQIKAWLDKIGKAFEGAPVGGDDPLLMEQVDELRRRRSADTTERATTQAERRIMDQAAGQKAMLKSGVLRRTGGQAGLEAKLAGRVDANAARAAAGAAADIALGRERDLDNLAIAGQGIMSAPSSLDLARRAAANGLLSVGLGGAGTLANVGLQDRSLGLQQWQTLLQDNREREAMEQAERARREGQALALRELELREAAFNGASGGGGRGGGALWGPTSGARTTTRAVGR